MATATCSVKIYRDDDNRWYFALWIGGEYDTNGEIDDAGTEQEARDWVASQWPGTDVRRVENAQ